MYYFEKGKLKMERTHVSTPEAAVLRLAIFGDSFVGKTTIAQAMLGQKSKKEYQSTVHDFYEGLVDIGGRTVKLEIVDTSGEYCFPSMKSLAVSLSDVCILVYSMDSKKSLESAKRIEKETINTSVHNREVPIVIFGNKVDSSNKELSEEEALDVIGNELNYPHVFFSAKYNYGMTDILNWLLTVKEGFAGSQSKDSATKESKRGKKLWKKLRTRIFSVSDRDSDKGTVKSS